MDSLLLYIALGSQLGAPLSIIHRIVSSSRNFLTLVEQNDCLISIHKHYI